MTGWWASLGSARAILDELRKKPGHFLPALVSLIVLLGFAFATPLSRLGDASDYLLMTESLYWDHDLKWETRDLGRHLLLLRDIRLDSPIGLQTTEGRDGIPRLTGHHSFYYPALAVPFYAVFRYRGFFVLNALLCWCFILLLVRNLLEINDRAVAWSAALIAVGFSAAWTYVGWIHAEIFLMTLCGAFAFLWRRGRILVAGGVLGLLTGAQAIFAVLALPFIVVEVLNRSRIRTLVAAALLGLVAATPQYLYNVRAFGVIHPLAGSNVFRLTNITIDRFVRSLIDPAAGLIWFYPAVLVVPFCIRWDRRFVASVSGAFGVLLAALTSPVWYTHQVGLRYCAYVFPLFLFGSVAIPVSGLAPLVAATWLAIVGAGLATNPVGNSLTMSIADKSFLPYRLARLLPFYREDLEVLWYQLALLAPDAGLRPGWTDGWTAGGEEALLVLRQVPDVTSVTLDINPWFAVPGRQHLTVTTAGGVTRALELQAGSVTQVTIPLGFDDLRHGAGRLEQVVVLRLRADPWVPILADPQIHDNRRLGVKIVGITSDRKTWLAPRHPGPGKPS